MDKRLDTPPSAQELNSDGYRRRRIIRQFSLLEVFGYLTAAQLLAYRQWLEAAVPPQANPILIPIYLFTSPDVLLALGAGFFAMLALMLNGITPIVSVLARTSGRLVQPDFDAFQRPPDERRDQFATPKDHVVIAEYKLGTPEAPIGENGPNDLPGDALEANFISYINRSQDAARLAQRRPNALLFVGTSIAAGGLVFFVMTLPGSRYGLGAEPTTAVIAGSSDFWVSMTQLVPRLLMLIFIQVLAGFFLRQYRSSVEDFRYYESVLRHREAQYLSYALRKKIDDGKALLKFADALLTDREFGLIKKGQSTTMLEAQKSEMNEFSPLYERLIDLVKHAEKKGKKERKEDPSD